jgi:hypothetical protein
VSSRARKNLLLPVEGSEVERKYILADTEVINRKKNRTMHWWLPVEGSEVMRKYKLGYMEVRNRKKNRTMHWSRICHPIGQLLGCMVDIKCRYGALTILCHQNILCSDNRKWPGRPDNGPTMSNFVGEIER